jgi:HD-like signal output (HDOD) protein/tRNA A-37 threonylcarbamoyl transferase component Bud32
MSFATLLLLVSIVIVVLVILLYFFSSKRHTQSPQKSAPKVIPAKEVRPRKAESINVKEMQPHTDSIPVKEMDLKAVVIPGEAGIFDIHSNIKRFIQTGIEALFAGRAGLESDRRKPLTLRDIPSETLDSVVKQIDNLKHFRAEHVRLQKIINDPAVGMSELSKIILADPILTAKILRMANSAYFGLQHKINSITHALMILGLQNIMNIAYREGMLQLFKPTSPEQGEAVAALWKHSNLASICASHLHDLFEGLNKGTLFTLGIIHDIGKLIVLGLPQSRKQEAPPGEKHKAYLSVHDEDQIFGINHAVIGQIALEQWNFSALMVKSVAMHHVPSYADAVALGSDNEQLKYILVLFLADQMAKLMAERDTETIRIDPLLDSYHTLIDRNRLTNKVTDANFLAQMREAETIALSEQQSRPVDIAEVSDRRHLQEGIDSTSFKMDTVTRDTVTTAISLDSRRHISRYEIIRELGRGAMGTVYLGRDPLINREVVIKTLQSQSTDDEETAKARARFFREAEAMGKLSHPNIVTVYDIGDCEGTVYMAMELLDGSNLIPYCGKNNRLPIPDVMKIAASVAKALDHAHGSGVVHRDIKPGNIQILKSGDVKVLDFGIARVKETSQTRIGVIVGSPGYMSPEQVEGHELDGRSDLFSLGAVFYELLAGERPFKGDSLTALFLQITAARPAPIKTLCPEVPERCVAIIEKAMAKDKEQRYQTGKEMADDIIECLNSI